MKDEPRDDGAGGGQYFGASGVPSLDPLIYDVIKEVEEPRTPGHSVYEDRLTRGACIGRLGGGSDYPIFLDYIGIPCINLGFGSPGGVCHSAYGDLCWTEHWGDPGYLHHAAMASLAGLAALPLAHSFANSPHTQDPALACRPARGLHVLPSCGRINVRRGVRAALVFRSGLILLRA